MKTESVKFNGAEIVCVIDDCGRIFVVMKPLCDLLGLGSDWQIKAISEDEILGAERCEHTVQIPAESKNSGAEHCEQLKALVTGLFFIY